MTAALPLLSATDAFGALDGVDALVLLVAPGEDAPELLPGSGAGADLAAGFGLDLAGTLARLEVTGAAGQAVSLPLPVIADDDRWAQFPPLLLFAGGDGSAVDARRAGAAIARAARPGQVVAIADLAGLTDPAATALVEGLVLASYRHPFRGAGPGPTGPADQFRLVGVDPDALAGGLCSAEATVVARRWAATPSNVKNPQWFAEQAVDAVEALGRRSGGSAATTRVRVHDEQWIREHGLGGLAAVGNGSATPPRLVVVEYTPAGAEPGRIVLVGKGITYDTGGISIKPRAAMVPMKTDMAGAAAVLAAVLGAAEAGVATSVVGVLPMAENAFSGGSYRPGDIVTIADGTTVEIGNTDAEGRMVLADGMAWARAHYEPEAMIDVATLTGAASLGLGKEHGALYATADRLAHGLESAGEQTGEALWRMPLVDDYAAALTSPVADLSHISRDRHVGGGSITAALFLRHFAGDVPWAHLDIAGPGRAARTTGILTEGATGFGARTLLRFLRDY
ncbi:M17 family metallopeptidase [Pseudactinotalea sp. HY158]|uniref:leucyl aminopeptidase family protein n=1 Tax=Pseudactinotalea sp. HY158 TaxID=2654547 RepID=UPI00129D1493|nr:leucyl aminopeptidase family protein [Pseudactinotalea sp. HY158]QGH70287.1 leucyl aminopeptidase family protein [Pseudactinotalea sp. HY158]